ncbi:MAG: AAA family ATPase [Dongiaceae bacterium]
MTPAEIASALKAKPAKGGWIACCPAHKDSTPSLSIGTGDNGKVIFKCHAECSQEEVIEALRSRGLWGGANGKSDSVRFADPPGRHPDLGEPDHKYEYTTGEGRTLGYVYRWEARPGRKKEIRPLWRIDGLWQWKAAPDPRPLYGLAEMAEFPDKHVLVVEGEKSAEGARDHIDSHCVVTWPGGTGAVAHVDLSPLKGKHVCLWPDNDEAGRKAMRAIADRLTDARAVRGVKLPAGLPEGWDLGDAVPVNLDPVALVGRAVDLRQERLASLPIKKATALAAANLPAIRWAVPELVPDGVSILAGPKSRGKSFIVLDLALAVASGGPALGNIICPKGDVLYLCLEDSERRVRDRMKAILQDRPTPEALDYATEWKTVDDGGMADIEAWIAGHPSARLVIVDVLAKVKGRPDPSRGVYDQDYATIGPFHALARSRGLAIILVHHTNKGAAADPVLRISGTMGLSGAADTTLVLSREARELHGTLDVRGRDAPEREIALQFDPDTGCVIQLGAAADFRLSEGRRAILRILSQNVDPMTPADVAQALGRNRSSVRWLLTTMHKAGEISKLPNGKYYVTRT